MLERLLICTDLDRTLLPNGPQPESPEAGERLSTLVAHPGVHLVFVSGRDRGLIREAIADYGLPTPDYVIGDVGTSIDHVIAGDWRRLIQWDQRIAPDWAGCAREDLAAMLADIPELQLQETAKQNRFKLSYYYDASLDTEVLSGRIAPRFAAAGIRVRLVWSADDTHGTGFLDVLPASASKYHAIRALMTMTGFDLAHTVFCGDSGNDMEVLASPVPSVLVGNAQAAVREQAEHLARQVGHEAWLYCAQGGFLGMNGHYRGGMLEGIAHYYPDTVAWMTSGDADRRGGT